VASAESGDKYVQGYNENKIILVIFTRKKLFSKQENSHGHFHKEKKNEIFFLSLSK